jgi:hypothetical protein
MLDAYDKTKRRENPRPREAAHSILRICRKTDESEEYDAERRKTHPLGAPHSHICGHDTEEKRGEQ